jgi:hypothetical protein
MKHFHLVIASARRGPFAQGSGTTSRNSIKGE